MLKPPITMMTGRISIHQGSRRKVLPSRDSGKRVGEPAIGGPPAWCRVVKLQVFSNEIYVRGLGRANQRMDSRVPEDFLVENSLQVCVKPKASISNKSHNCSPERCRLLMEKAAARQPSAPNNSHEETG